MSDTEAQLREEFHNAFSNADYPVQNQMDLVPALPNGPGTMFEAGDVSVSAMELASRAGDHQDFPYESVDALVDDLIEALHDEGML